MCHPDRGGIHGSRLKWGTKQTQRVFSWGLRGASRISPIDLPSSPEQSCRDGAQGCALAEKGVFVAQGQGRVPGLGFLHVNLTLGQEGGQRD